MITRADKENEIKGIVDRMGKSKGAFIVDFKGMKVEQVTSLRKKLVQADSEMKVVRNTLAKRALKDFPAVQGALSGSLTGTNAFVFSYGEVHTTAKTLADFAKDVERLQIKSGIMDGAALDAKQVKALAALPGKDALRSMLLGVLLAAGSSLARALNARSEQLGAGGAGKAEESAAAPAAEPTTT